MTDGELKRIQRENLAIKKIARKGNNILVGSVNNDNYIQISNSSSNGGIEKTIKEYNKKELKRYDILK
jgi:hypothetical protein